MSNRTHATKDARKLEKLYATKENDVSHQTVVNLIHNKGLEAAIAQLESWGLKPVTQEAKP